MKLKCKWSNGAVGEAAEAVVEQAGGLGEVQEISHAVFLNALRSHDHADIVQLSLLSGGDETVSGGVRGAGFDAVGPLIPVADDPPVGQEVVGGIERPLRA